MLLTAVMLGMDYYIFGVHNFAIYLFQILTIKSLVVSFITEKYLVYAVKSKVCTVKPV